MNFRSRGKKLRGRNMRAAKISRDENSAQRKLLETKSSLDKLPRMDLVIVHNLCTKDN